MRVKNEAGRSGLNSTTFWLLTLALVLSVLHLTDHVLRVDHSGWPFRPEVTPFTFSLLAIPMLLFAMFGSRQLFWWRWWLLVIGTAATLYAHSAIETPHMQFAMWAHDQSSDPHQQGFHNLPNVHSPILGVLSMTVAMTLNLVAVACCISMFAQRRQAIRQRL